MDEVYRGHRFVLGAGEPRCVVIIEQNSGLPLPTKITAMPDEPEQACLSRARALVDIYLSMLTGPPANQSEPGSARNDRAAGLG